jgi:Mg-dependent DNase
MLSEYVTDERCIAIGEFGLDYGRMSYDEAIYKPIIEQQKKVLKAHLEFALKHQKPVIIHLRDGKFAYEHRSTAYDDFIEIVQPYLGKLVGGVIHALNFDKQEYMELHKYGFYFGIGGQITFREVEGLKAFVKKAPLSSLLLETDAPWLTMNGCSILLETQVPTISIADAITMVPANKNCCGNVSLCHNLPFNCIFIFVDEPKL